MYDMRRAGSADDGGTAKITGSDADLRKLSNTDAAAILLKHGPRYGIDADQVASTTDRWV